MIATWENNLIVSYKVKYILTIITEIRLLSIHPPKKILTYMQSTPCEMPGWMKHKLESRLPGKISITSDMQMTPLFLHKVKKN